MKHSPGEWIYEKDGQMISAPGMRGNPEHTFHVASVRGWGHLQYLDNGDEIQDANGKLIAAAPELLEALLQCVSAEACTPGFPEYEKAKLAIKKATQ